MHDRLIDSQDANVPFMTPALHYGMAVFEGIRCYDTGPDTQPNIFKLKEHAQRLHRSALILGFDAEKIPSVEAIETACRRVVEANNFKECYIRPVIYLAQGGWTLSLKDCVPQFIVSAWIWDSYLVAGSDDKGIKLKVSSYTRHHPNSTMAKCKVAGNYVNAFLAKTEAQRLGFDDAVLLDAQGRVAEASGANIFAVRNEKLYTPPLTSILDGITRQTVIDIAKCYRIDVIEQELSRDDLVFRSDEVFLTGTAVEIAPVSQIDFTPIKVGLTTRTIRSVYSKLVRNKTDLDCRAVLD